MLGAMHNVDTTYPKVKKQQISLEELWMNYSMLR
jgi:hypothetical protein